MSTQELIDLRNTYNRYEKELVSAVSREDKKSASSLGIQIAYTLAVLCDTARFVGDYDLKKLASDCRPPLESGTGYYPSIIDAPNVRAFLKSLDNFLSHESLLGTASYNSQDAKPTQKIKEDDYTPILTRAKHADVLNIERRYFSTRGNPWYTLWEESVGKNKKAQFFYPDLVVRLLDFSDHARKWICPVEVINAENLRELYKKRMYR